MFLRRAIFRPLAGKGPALRDALVSGQRPGRWNVTERLAGPSVEFRLQFFYESLSDLQRALEAAQAQQPQAPIAPLLAAAPALELEELLSPVPDGPPPNYVVRTVFGYAPGKLGELRTLLEAIIKQRAGEGGRMNLAVRVSGGAPALLLAGFHQDLAVLETARAKALADAAGAAGVERTQRIGALLAHPVDLPDIFRIVARSA